LTGKENNFKQKKAENFTFETNNANLLKKYL